MIYIILHILSVFCVSVNGKVSLYRHFPRDCGRTRLGTPRIIEGDVAQLGQFPWMARIGLARYGSTVFYCGGSLINRYFVITAAHCRKYSGNIVRLGENYLDTDRDCSNGVCAPPVQDIRIKKFTSHRYYCAVTQKNDFALVELNKAVVLNEFVQPICFPDEQFGQDDLKKDPGVVAGWGYTHSKPNRHSNNLMYIIVPAIDKSACRTLYGIDLERDQLCMGYMKGKDTCDGDSGGPVVKYMRTDTGEVRVFQRALVSYGLPMCGKGPAVYTDVSHYAQWVREIIYKS